MKAEGSKMFDIQFEERDGYLYALVTGERDSLAISQEYWRQVIEQCHLLGYQHLLVEEEFPNQLSTMEVYTLIEAIVEMITSPLKIAFVDHSTEQNDLNLFAETLAVNRGIIGRVFSEMTNAEKWLMT